MVSNIDVAYWFFHDRGSKNNYGRSMFVHDGTLYSLAYMVLNRDPNENKVRYYHLEGGKVCRHAFPMAKFKKSKSGKWWLLLNNDWDRRFMTLNGHFKTLEDCLDVTPCIWVKNLREKEAHDTRKEYETRLRELLKKAIKARTRGPAYFYIAKSLAVRWSMYAACFGFHSTPLLCAVSMMPDALDKYKATLALTDSDGAEVEGLEAFG